MYRRNIHGATGRDNFQLLIPDDERGLLMRTHLLYSSHENAGHLRFGKCLEDLQMRVWWPGMYAATERHCQSCEPCQARGTSQDRASQHIPIQRLPPASSPFDRVHIDILGPLTTSRTKKQFIIVAVDHFTRWIEAESISHCPTAIDVNDFVCRHFFFRHGAPKSIFADNGTNITANQLNSYLFQALGSRVRNVTAYHPQANGMVERFNKPICDFLAAFCTDQDNADWDQRLDAVIHALNTSVSASTGFTPYFLVHGREAKRPIDQRLPTRWLQRFSGPKGPIWSTYAQQLLDTLHAAHKVAESNIDKAQSLYNAPRAFHQIISDNVPVTPRTARKFRRPFEPDDWVLVYVPVIPKPNPSDISSRKLAESHLQSLSARKLAKFWTGPFQVIRQINPVTYLIRQKLKDVPIHLSRLKRFHDRRTLYHEPFL